MLNSCHSVVYIGICHCVESPDLKADYTIWHQPVVEGPRKQWSPSGQVDNCKYEALLAGASPVEHLVIYPWSWGHFNLVLLQMLANREKVRPCYIQILQAVKLIQKITTGNRGSPHTFKVLVGYLAVDQTEIVAE